ncbi:MAG: glycoside hydrolase family 2 TIM barrel-domain containing protein, partial [Rectinemataceae bacterium]|nr:glycoside hydrolase family 2 TIM barrel-domain containing protein [Rectinemataceae bacterium]
MINVCGHIRNSGIHKKEIIVENIILGPDGSEIIRTTTKLYVDPGTRKAFKTHPVEIKNPGLWSPSCPTLYTLRSYIKDNSNDAILDSVNNRFGIRTVKVVPEKGFMLNGDKLFLKGVGKHQDYGTLGFAVPNQTIENDVRLARDMGANLLRSHYPLSQSTYEAADRLGIMGFIKLPVMFKINHSKEFYDSTRRMAEEMVLQYFNHPSVALWGSSCEPFGDMDWYWPRPLDKKKVSENMRKTRSFFSKLEKVVKGLDPYRPTSSDYHSDPNPQFHAEAGLLDIQDINGWNIYQGWYHANLAKFPSML